MTDLDQIKANQNSRTPGKRRRRGRRNATAQEHRLEALIGMTQQTLEANQRFTMQALLDMQTGLKSISEQFAMLPSLLSQGIQANNENGQRALMALMEGIDRTNTQHAQAIERLIKAIEAREAPEVTVEGDTAPRVVAIVHERNGQGQIIRSEPTYEGD